MSYELTGLSDKVAVVTGAGRMRSIGRPIAVQLARAGCDIVLTGTGRSPDRYPDDEKAAGWRDIESVAEEVRAEGRRALTAVSDVSDLGAVEALAEQVIDDVRAGRHRGQQRRGQQGRGPPARRRSRSGPVADDHRRQPHGFVPDVEGRSAGCSSTAGAAGRSSTSPRSPARS